MAVLVRRLGYCQHRVAGARVCRVASRRPNAAPQYDAAGDALHVGIDCYSVCGDADGDGDPDRTSPQLLQRGGVDNPRMSRSESFAIAIDLG